MRTYMPITIDFAKDWVDAAIAEFASEGHSIAAGARDFTAVCHALYNLQDPVNEAQALVREGAPI
jgi:hypothetical protein